MKNLANLGSFENTGHAELYRMYPIQDIPEGYEILLNEYFDNEDKIGYGKHTSLDEVCHRRDMDFMRSKRLPFDKLQQIVENQRDIIKALPRIQIGNRIKELRQKRGLSQADLAEMTGLIQQNIARIETGKYSTGLDILSKIAAALKCDLDFVETNFKPLN